MEKGNKASLLKRVHTDYGWLKRGTTGTVLQVGDGAPFNEYWIRFKPDDLEHCNYILIGRDKLKILS